MCIREKTTYLPGVQRVSAMIMTTGRFSPLQIVPTLDKSSRLFGMRVSLRGKRSEWARLAWLANGTALTTSDETASRLSLGCDDRNANVDVLNHRDEMGGFTAIEGTILPAGGQSYPAYDPSGNQDVNLAPRTTKYRCWSLREGLDSRK
jgi:hypothetical protein